MDVSAQTLREVEFREKLRGYHPDDVDEFLERVAAGIDYLQDRLRQATERAQRAESKASLTTEGDDALKRTLVLAQRTAEMAVQEARQEAERIAAAASAEANAIVAQAEELARRTIEETQGGIRAELTQLESARDRLRHDISTLERHLEEERERLRASLASALNAVDEHLSPGAPAPKTAPVEIPPKRDPRVGPLPEIDLTAVAAAVEPEPEPEPQPEPAPAPKRPVAVAEPASVFEAPRAPESQPQSEPSAPDVVESVAEAKVSKVPPARPVFDELAAESVPEVVEAPSVVEPAPAADQSLLWARTDTTAPPASAVEEEEEDEDPFIAELRRAITDTQPLGPRDEDDVSDADRGDDLVHGDVLDSSRLGSLLRRRR